MDNQNRYRKVTAYIQNNPNATEWAKTRGKEVAWSACGW